MNQHQAAADLYRRLGWQPGVASQLVWIRAGRVLDALEVPRLVGERTISLLTDTGPIFEAPEGNQCRWVFLTQPAHRMIEALAMCGVEHITATRTLDLPPSKFGPHSLHWLTPPTAPLPPFTIVAEAIMLAAS
jgi:hypothetical protein